MSVSALVLAVLCAPAAFSFEGRPYFHRYSKAGLHEFTPAGQEKLDKWTDMVTLNLYPKAKSGEDLAASAETVLNAYKSAGGRIVRTNSVPRTSTKPAEHFIAVVFVRQGFAEAAFARFVLHKGAGLSVVSSKRFYGEKATGDLGSWLTKNGEKREKALMAMSPLPKAP